MDTETKDLMGNSFECNCGRLHRIPTKHLFYGKNALDSLVETAASMNGYASANVAATVGGLKVLFYADACEAVLSALNGVELLEANSCETISSEVFLVKKLSKNIELAVVRFYELQTNNVTIHSQRTV